MNAPNTQPQTSPFAGMLVRDTAHAMGVAKTTEMRAVSDASSSELTSDSTYRARP